MEAAYNNAPRTLYIGARAVCGHIGARALVPPLETSGVFVSVLASAQFSNSPELAGGFDADASTPDDLHRSFNFLTRNGLTDYGSIIVGYVPSRGFVREVERIIQQIKEKNENVDIILSPLLGHDGKLISAPQAVSAYQEMLPSCDYLICNAQELMWLTSRPYEQMLRRREAYSIIDEVHRRGAKNVFVTHVNLDEDTDSLHAVVSGATGPLAKSLAAVPRIHRSFIGAGDLVAGCFVARLVRGESPVRAAEYALTVCSRVLKLTHEAKSTHIILPLCYHVLLESIDHHDITFTRETTKVSSEGRPVVNAEVVRTSADPAA